MAACLPGSTGTSSGRAANETPGMIRKPLPPWATSPSDNRLDVTIHRSLQIIIKNIIIFDYPTVSISQMVPNQAWKLDTPFPSKTSSQTIVSKTQLQFLPLNYSLSSPVSLDVPSSLLLLKFLYYVISYLSASKLIVQCIHIPLHSLLSVSILVTLF